MNTSMIKLPTLPSNALEKYINDMNASDATQASNIVFFQSTGSNPQYRCSINSITNAIEEGVKGVNGVAESTQMLVTDMEKISKRMEENQQISSELQNETSIFTRICS